MNEQDIAGISIVKFKLFRRNINTLENPEYEYAWFRSDGQQVCACFSNELDSIEMFKKVPIFLRDIRKMDNEEWDLCKKN